MRALVFSFFVAFLLPVSAFAGAAVKDCNKAQSSADVMRCLNAQYEIVQEELNTVFDRLTGQKSGEELVQVKRIQTHWLEYRTLACAQETAVLEGESLKRLETLRCKNRLTQERIVALQNALHKDDVRAVIGEAAAQPRWMNALAVDYPDVFWRYGGRVSVDLDCDGENEYIMSGLKFDKQDIDYKTVVSISENPVTGRPQSFVLETPRSVSPPEDGADLNARCFGLVDFVFEQASHESAQTDGAEEAGIKSDGAEAAAETCASRLVVKDRQVKSEGSMCREHIILWDGRAYVLSP
ncbi:MAG: lysozyme inhibitor LprI family protein [Alphaproteobacteria bacterium]